MEYDDIIVGGGSEARAGKRRIAKHATTAGPIGRRGTCPIGGAVGTMPGQHGPGRPSL